MNNTTYKLILLRKIEQEVKIGVTIMDFLMTCYVLWLIITNNSSWLAGVILGFTPYGAYMLLRANKLFGLCWIHRFMIIHIMLVYACCVYQAYIGFGDSLIIMRWIMFMIGFILNSFSLYRSSKCICYDRN